MTKITDFCHGFPCSSEDPFVYEDLIRLDLEIYCCVSSAVSLWWTIYKVYGVMQTLSLQVALTVGENVA
jgi:hypothetical protein